MRRNGAVLEADLFDRLVNRAHVREAVPVDSLGVPTQQVVQEFQHLSRRQPKVAGALLMLKRMATLCAKRSVSRPRDAQDPPAAAGTSAVCAS